MLLKLYDLKVLTKDKQISLLVAFESAKIERKLQRFNKLVEVLFISFSDAGSIPAVSTHKIRCDVGN